MNDPQMIAGVSLILPVFNITLALGSAAAFSLLPAVFLSPVLRLLGAGSSTFVFARQYMFTVVVLSGVPTILTNVLSNLLRSLS